MTVLIDKLKELMYFAQGASTALEPIPDKKGASNALYNIFTNLKQIIDEIDEISTPLDDKKNTLLASDIRELQFTVRTQNCIYAEN
jgi:hypothetical protein